MDLTPPVPLPVAVLFAVITIVGICVLYKLVERLEKSRTGRVVIVIALSAALADFVWDLLH